MFDVQKIAKLSRLNLSDQQINKLQPQLKEIIQFFEILQKVDSDSIEGYGLSDSETAFREDSIAKQEIPAQGVTLARSCRDSMFFVPKVIDSSEA